MKHTKYGIINWFIRLALGGKPLTVFGEDLQKRDYVFEEDLAAGIVKSALSQNTKGQVYNLGSGVGTPFIDMVRLIAEVILGTEIQHLPWPQDRYLVESGDFIADISKITKDMGWVSQISLREGIEKTVAYYRQYREQY